MALKEKVVNNEKHRKAYFDAKRAKAKHAAVPVGDLVRGEMIFKTMCMGCHTMAMRGIYGEEVCGGYGPYTHSLSYYAGRKWDFALLNRWLANPREMAPETTMNSNPIKDY